MSLSYQDSEDQSALKTIRKKLVLHTSLYKQVLEQNGVFGHLIILSKIIQFIIFCTVILVNKQPEILDNSGLSMSTIAEIYRHSLKAVDTISLVALTVLAICLIIQVYTLVSLKERESSCSKKSFQSWSNQKKCEFFYFSIMKIEIGLKIIIGFVIVPALYLTLQQSNLTSLVSGDRDISTKHGAIFGAMLILQILSQWPELFGLIGSSECIFLFGKYLVIAVGLYETSISPLDILIILLFCGYLVIRHQALNLKTVQRVLYANIMVVGCFSLYQGLFLDQKHSEQDRASEFEQASGFSTLQVLFLLSCMVITTAITFNESRKASVGTKARANQWVLKIIDTAKSEYVSEQIAEDDMRYIVKMNYQFWTKCETEERSKSIHEQFDSAELQGITQEPSNIESNFQQAKQYFLNNLRFDEHRPIKKSQLIEWLWFKIKFETDSRFRSVYSAKQNRDQDEHKFQKKDLLNHIFLLKLIIISFQNHHKPKSCYEMSLDAHEECSNCPMFLYELKSLTFIKILAHLNDFVIKVREIGPTLGLANELALVEFSQFIDCRFYKQLPSIQSHYQNPLNVDKTIQSSELSQKFFIMVYQGFLTLENFWKTMFRKVKSDRQVLKSFQKVLSVKRDIVNVYDSLKLLTVPQRERIVIKHFLSFVSVGEMDATENEMQVQELNNDSECTDSLSINKNFLIVRKGFVLRVSIQFLNCFGYKEEDCIMTEIEKFIPQNFDKYFQKIMNSVNQVDQNSIILPIACKNGELSVKRCRLMVCPDISGSISYLVAFEDLVTDKEHREKFQYREPALFFYDLKCDTIEEVNKSFVDDFKLDLEAVQRQMKKSKLLSNELLLKIDLSSYESRQLLREKKHLNGEIATKNLVAPHKKRFTRSPKNISGKFKVNISLLEKYGVYSDKPKKEEDLFLIKIKRGNYTSTENEIKPFISQRESCGSSTSQDFDIYDENDEVKLADKYAKEQFFCPIRNPYSSKITAKQAELSQPGRVNYITLIRILRNMGFFLFFSQAIYFAWSSEQRLKQYQSRQNVIFDSSREFFQIGQMYSDFFLMNKIVLNPVGYSAAYPQKSVEKVLDEMKEIQNSRAEKFTSTYLDTLHISKLKPITYTIRFRNFNASTSTHKSALLDFIQNFRNFPEEEDSKLFLVDNYKEIRRVTLQFQRLMENTEEVEDIQNNIYLSLLVTFVFGALIMSLMAFLVIRVELTIIQIYQLLSTVGQEDAQQVLLQINKTYRTIKQFTTASDLISKNNLFSVSRGEQVSDKQQFETQNLLVKSSITEKNSRKRYCAQNESESFESSIQELDRGKRSLNRQSNPQSGQNSETQIIQSSFKFYVITISVFLTLLAFILLIFYRQLSYLDRQQQVFVSLFKYQQQISSSYLQIIRTECDREYDQQLKLSGLVDQEIRNYYNNISILTHFQLPDAEEFRTFKIQENSRLYSDICRQDVEFSMQHLTCETIGHGILYRGFSETYAYLLEITRRLMQMSLMEMYMGKRVCDEEGCPLSLQAIKIVMILSDLFEEFISETRQLYSEFVEKRSGNLINWTLLDLIMNLCCAVLLQCWTMEQGKRCSEHLRLFNAIPPSLMYKIKMTNYLRKHEVLDKISIL